MNSKSFYLFLLCLLMGVVSVGAQSVGVEVEFPAGEIPIRYADASALRRTMGKTRGIKISLIGENYRTNFDQAVVTYWLNNSQKQDTLLYLKTPYHEWFLEDVDLRQGRDTLHFMVEAEGYKTLIYELSANSPYIMVVRIDKIKDDVNDAPKNKETLENKRKKIRKKK